MICENCGMAVVETARFCSGCGSATVYPAGTPSLSVDPRATLTPVTALFMDQPSNRPSPSIACLTHPTSVAAGACVGCGNFYCRECLSNYENRNYCSNCVARGSASLPRNLPAYRYQQTGAPAQPSDARVSHYSQPAYAQHAQNNQYAQQYVKRKEPAVALLLSFFWPGAGQIYNGDVGKGITFMVGFWFLIWIGIGIIFWIWAMIDAYQNATNINSGRRL